MDICILRPAYRDISIEKQTLKNSEFTINSGTIDEAANARAVLVRDLVLDKPAIDQLKRCEVVVRYGVGYNTVDVAALSKRGILLCNIPDYDTDDVSTHALALFLGLRRNLKTRDLAVRQGDWALDDAVKILSPKGQIAGLVGFGRIAKRLAEKLKPFGFDKILAYDPFASDESFASQNVQRTEIDEIAKYASVISLHIPLTEDTKYIINQKRLQQMRKDCLIINTSRGGLIDEDALADALKQEQIAGAGLDVFEQEPPDLSKPIFTAPNTLFSDHCGWYSETAMHDLRSKAALEACRVLNGKPAFHPINQDSIFKL